MFYSFSFLYWSIATLYLQFASAWQIGEQVKTSSGPVKGHASSWQPDVSEYLGIPYALPPVGLLRWTTPRPFTGDTVIQAQKFGYDCPANTGSTGELLASMGKKDISSILGPLLQVGHEFSEDCLTINVWTKPQTGEKAKAVLLWFYGGGFFLGSSSVPIYDGARLANENDVIVVSLK
jgi:cholinesterase